VAENVAAQTPETPATPPSNDPYDLGDTNLAVELPEKTAKTPEPEPKPEPIPPNGVIEDPEAKTDRPRNPDGTFAKVPKHEAYLVQQAEEFGYGPEDIEELSPQALRRVITQHRNHQRLIADQFSKQHAIDQNKVHVPVEAPKTEDDDIDLGLDEAQYDPQLVAAMKKLARSQSQEVKSLKAQLAERDQRDQQREGLRLESIIDGAFSSMGDKFEKIFGKGAGRDVSQKDQAGYRRRLAVLRDAQINVQNMTPAQIKAKIRESVELMYPDTQEAYGEVVKQGASNDAPSRITPEQWANGTVAKPTQRKGEEPKGDAKAIRNLTARMKESSEVMPDSEEMDGFLG